MSKNVNKFMDVFRSGSDAVKKLSGAHRLGERIFPSKTSKNDKKHQLRIDAGPLIDNRYRQVNLQVNSEATSQGLKDWIRKYGSHANLATAEFDTAAENPEEEAERLLEEMTKQARDNL